MSASSAEASEPNPLQKHLSQTCTTKGACSLRRLIILQACRWRRAPPPAGAEGRPKRRRQQSDKKAATRCCSQRHKLPHLKWGHLDTHASRDCAVFACSVEPKSRQGRAVLDIIRLICKPVFPPLAPQRTQPVQPLSLLKRARCPGMCARGPHQQAPPTRWCPRGSAGPWTLP